MKETIYKVPGTSYGCICAPGNQRLGRDREGLGVESATKDPYMNEAGLDVLGRSSRGPHRSPSTHSPPAPARGQWNCWIGVCLHGGQSAVGPQD